MDKAQVDYSQALAEVQAAQALVNQATAGIATAQANLNTANAALALALQNYNNAIAQEQAASQAVTLAKSVLDQSEKDAKAAEDTAKSCKDPVLKVQLQATADRLAAVAAANSTAYQNAVAALKSGRVRCRRRQERLRRG